MFDHIIAFSIRNKAFIGALTLALVIWGLWSASKLPIDAVPDITNNQVQVITQAPSLGAQEVEQFITAPIELALANIPDVLERRSVSRSGISVITIVFHDETDIYWARQQVSERLAEAEKSIPENIGDISLAPITTGLGEIYHYVIHTKPGYEDKYSATDLRTMQDWIVRTQLAGTEGLAEVSGWGGFVKQYEVALDNDRLNALGISIPEVFEALEKNNENTGGSYIEQRSNAYFIRGIGQVKSLSDIEKIVVRNTGGTPVLVRDVATVQFGSATRYGAVTRNGEGEVVAGIVLMLKGENFNQVIKNVKARMVQIQHSLPEGVVIEPFIDRTELVGRTIGTVEKNLLEGGLIVVFVLVLLLGNLRAGLIVASVIPLALLFALALMRVFGVSANLMSLGAIDFGLIVDGAVIIVESVVHRIFTEKHPPGSIKRLSRTEMDGVVQSSAGTMMNSAAFGQMIILIVYLPILALVGIEGKMFRPMAQTVAFAILGAFLLSLTYVPMASALFLSKNTAHRRNISDRIIDFLRKIYTPALDFVLRFKVQTVAVAVALFACSIFLFSKMGGEFIPTLEEGDLAAEIGMMQGASLTQTIATFDKAAGILKQQFPEVKQAVTRIGSAEIPTDPMPVERGDMMIAMIPKEQWRPEINTREKMQEAMEKAMSVIPGITVEMTQPMQLRFNELITGIRQDVAIKIFGDDLDLLSQKAGEVAQLIGPVAGVSSPQVEKVTGLPQILVTYDRDRMAQYGLNISDVNMILHTAFAGNVAGVVFEGEKRFDLVVRLKRELRENISNIENLYIPLPNGNRIPLSQVARIEFKSAPAQVSREDGKRRIYVGFNVRGRDVESTVKEIQELLAQKLQLPGGYYVTYGGQFQNLEEAKSRLLLAVPMALLLILVLLYAAFRSLRQSLLIFTAVPLSAIGGVFALWLRDMPFSISAGVGFIALFGVAVLNGIVLIGYFNQLEKEGWHDIQARVREGTRTRLRPVIMTASVASLGFLPMALSLSAGAEVQKPLATVVIGGLVTATLLTLLVLPVLYILFSGEKNRRNKVPAAALLLFGLLGLAPGVSTAQTQTVSLEQCLKMALEQNPALRGASMEIRQSQAMEGTARDFGKTALTLTQDPTSGGNMDNSIGIAQNFPHPALTRSRAETLHEQTILSEKNREVAQNQLVREVRTAYYQLLFYRQKAQLLGQQDSLFDDFLKRAELRQKSGETGMLEVLAAQNRQQQARLARRQSEQDAAIWQYELQKLTAAAQPLQPVESTLPKLPLPTPGMGTNPLLDFWQQKSRLAAAQITLVKKENLPEFSAAVFPQLILPWYSKERAYSQYGIGGIQLGATAPLFNRKPFRARLQAAQIGRDMAQNQLAAADNTLQTQRLQSEAEMQKWQDALDFYEKSGLQRAAEIMRIARLSYDKGEITYLEYLQALNTSIETNLGYLDALIQFDGAVIQTLFIQGK